MLTETPELGGPLETFTCSLTMILSTRFSYKSLLLWCLPCVLNPTHQTEAQVTSGPDAGREEGQHHAGLGHLWWTWRMLAIQKLGTPCHLLCPVQPDRDQPGAGLHPTTSPAPSCGTRRRALNMPGLPQPPSQPLLLLLPSLESSPCAVHSLVPFPRHWTRVLHLQREYCREVFTVSIGSSLARDDSDHVVRMSGFSTVWLLFSLCN